MSSSQICKGKCTLKKFDEFNLTNFSNPFLCVHCFTNKKSFGEIEQATQTSNNLASTLQTWPSTACTTQPYTRREFHKELYNTQIEQ